MDTSIAVPDKLSVSIGLPCGSPYMPWQTAMSLAKTVHVLGKQGVETRIECIAGSSIVSHARNQVAKAFLEQNDTDRLFWIDADMVWTPDQFLKLLVLSYKYDVVCATYPMKREDKALVIKHPDLAKFEINQHGLIKVFGVGLGFTIVTRKVMEEIAAAKPWVTNPASAGKSAYRDIFELRKTKDPEGHTTGQGEDMAFFDDVRAAGYSIWLDPTIQLGHVGSYVYVTDPVAGLGLDHVYTKGKPCPDTMMPASTPTSPPAP